MNNITMNPDYKEEYHAEIRQIKTSEKYCEDETGYITMAFVYIHNETGEVCAIDLDYETRNKERKQHYFHRIKQLKFDLKRYWFSTPEDKVNTKNDLFLKSKSQEDMEKQIQTSMTDMILKIRSAYEKPLVYADDFSVEGKFYDRYLKFMKDKNSMYLNFDEDIEKVVKIY